MDFVKGISLVDLLFPKEVEDRSNLFYQGFLQILLFKMVSQGKGDAGGKIEPSEEELPLKEVTEFKKEDPVENQNLPFPSLCLVAPQEKEVFEIFDEEEILKEEDVEIIKAEEDVEIIKAEEVLSDIREGIFLSDFKGPERQMEKVVEGENPRNDNYGFEKSEENPAKGKDEVGTIKKESMGFKENFFSKEIEISPFEGPPSIAERISLTELAKGGDDGESLNFKEPFEPFFKEEKNLKTEVPSKEGEIRPLYFEGERSEVSKEKIVGTEKTYKEPLPEGEMKIEKNTGKEIEIKKAEVEKEGFSEPEMLIQKKELSERKQKDVDFEFLSVLGNQRDVSSKDMKDKGPNLKEVSALLEKKIEEFFEKPMPKKTEEMLLKVKVEEGEPLLIGLREEGGRISVNLRTEDKGLLFILQSEKQNITKDLNEKGIPVNLSINEAEKFEKRDKKGREERKNRWQRIKA